MTTIKEHTLDNGLRIATERIESASSAAISIRLPIGSARDPDDKEGLAAVIEELLLRGSEQLDSRAQADAFDHLGASRSTSTTTTHTVLSSTAIGTKLTEVIPLLAEMIRAPRLADDAFEVSRELCLQTVKGLPDDPADLVMHELRKRHAPPPLNKPSIGTAQGLAALTPDDPRNHLRAVCRPGGTIIAAAGDIDHDTIVRAIEVALGDDTWNGTTEEPHGEPDAAQRGVTHTEQKTNQTHIAIAYDSPPEADPNAPLERTAAAVLSGGMAGRLFTELREKKSLCYAVSASYASGKRFGRTTAYIGTTPERAQESLDSLLHELTRITEAAGAVTQDEFDRARTGLKSRTVMSGESTRARANALAADLYRLDRARSLDDIVASIDAVTLDRLNDYLQNRTMGRTTIASVGPAPLNAPAAQSHTTTA